jgi:RNA polymerase sigma-70 factor (ECF subfamily)
LAWSIAPLATEQPQSDQHQDENTRDRAEEVDAASLRHETVVWNRIESVLVARIKRDDTDAFAQIFRRYYQPLVKHAARALPSVDMAHDIVQELFLDIWRRRTELDENKNLKSYLYQAVGRRVGKFRRHNRIAEAAHASFEAGGLAPAMGQRQSNISADLEYRELFEACWNAVAELPDRVQRVAVLRFEKKMTCQEIAETLGVSIATVPGDAHRAAEAMQRVLAAHR